MPVIKNNEFVKNAEQAWDEAADIHREYRYQQLLKGFSQPGFVSMPAVRLEILQKQGVSGKSAFQPCCNNGRDILSLKNMGATDCLGFDISGKFIQQGKDFARAGNIDCELIQADVFAMGHDRDGRYDICLISLGTLMWMPDLPAFFGVMARMLKPGGWLFIHEFHPLSEVFVTNPRMKRIDVARSYFSRNPEHVIGGLDYFGGKQYNATPCYRFLHGVGDIITAMASSGFKIETLTEYEEDMSSGTFKQAQFQKFPVPRSYTLTATRV